MALGDVVIFDDGVAIPGAKRFKVNTGGPAGINAGELVLTNVGNQGTTGSGHAGVGSFVTQWGTSVATKPSPGTDWVAGLAASTSTETLSATGFVNVFPNMPGMTYLISPNSTTAYNTQAKYDLLVGARVALNTDSNGVQTILATDKGPTTASVNGAGGGFGLVVEPLDVNAYPGKVRFSLKASLDPRTR